MLCITGAEGSLAAWERRVLTSDRRCLAAGLALPLHELRLDALDAIDDEVFERLRERRKRTVVCCRPLSQGGHFRGPPNERIELLHRAAKAGPAWLDAEAELGRNELLSLRACLASGESEGRGKLMISWHEFGSFPADLGLRVRRLEALGGDVLKLAIQLEDTAEVGQLIAAFDGVMLPRVVIGMGAAGFVTRSHYRALGSLFTYVSASDEQATAPGQFNLETAIQLGLPGSATTPIYGIVGGPQVLASPGLRVHNRFFRSRGLASSYVPIVTRTLAETLPVLESLGAVGLSVTMPLKLAAVSLCATDKLADEVGAVNTLRYRKRWEGTNTDIEGVQRPLSVHVQALGLRRAVILGSGGAARAALVACRELGLAVEIHARSLAAARSFSEGRATLEPWDMRGKNGTLADAALINTTPISGAESPWPASAPSDAALVFDTALGAPTSSLLERARGSGAVVLGPLAMWFAQAAAQLNWWFDEPVTAGELRELHR